MSGGIQADVVVGNRREHPALPLGAREQHVEPPLAAVAGDRPEPLRQVALGVAAVADRDEDHVALVALDVLQVLDEERLAPIAGALLAAERFQFGILGAHQFQLVEDRVALRHREGGHAQGGVGMRLRVPEHRPRHLLRLARIAPLAPAVVHAVHLGEGEAAFLPRGVGARRVDQPVVVEGVVGDRDQRGMVRAVVPAQAGSRHRARLAQGEDALHVRRLRRPDGRVVVGILRVVVHPLHLAVEEGGGRKLLGVADHDDLPRPRNRPQRVGRAHLTGLVNHQDVEGQAAGTEKLRHRERTHQQDRLDPDHRLTGPVEQRAQRPVAALLADLAPDHADLARRADRQRAMVQQRHFLRRQMAEPVVRAAKRRHLRRALAAVERRQQGILGAQPAPYRLGARVAEHVDRVRRGQAPVPHPRPQFVEPEFGTRLRGRGQQAPVGQRLPPPQPRGEPLAQRRNRDLLDCRVAERGAHRQLKGPGHLLPGSRPLFLPALYPLPQAAQLRRRRALFHAPLQRAGAPGRGRLPFDPAGRLQQERAVAPLAAPVAAERGAGQVVVLLQLAPPALVLQQAIDSGQAVAGCARRRGAVRGAQRGHCLAVAGVEPAQGRAPAVGQGAAHRYPIVVQRFGGDVLQQFFTGVAQLGGLRGEAGSLGKVLPEGGGL